MLNNLSKTAFLTLAMAGLCFLWACNNDDDVSSGFEVNNFTESYPIPRGTSVTIAFDVTHEGEVPTVTVNAEGQTGVEPTVSTNGNTTNVSYGYTLPGNARLNEIFTVEFDVRTASSGSTFNALVVASPVIETPTTYEFTREGVSTVSFSGQNDRLDQVEEIKDLLKLADAGQVISEQALLDMFENTGNNGGGNFSFTSDRQLKNKTFAPDLDNRFYETLFAEAATASVAGSNGVQAANGTAGLITRENSGNTILLDDKGREFTQLIEKGLMGSVFYHQIFNVYLTNDRIGDDVENTALREGSNYTDMEHHFDEAYGYFNAPVDFTSPWPSERGSEDRFWSHYSNVVDNVNGGQLGTNKSVMDAFILGRTAIVNNDLSAKDVQRDALYEQLELVAAATTVHYINETLSHLGNNSTGEAFHTLSEAWAFVNAIQYSPRKVLTLNQISTMQNTDFGADGNFWNVTTTGLNNAKATLVGAYPALEPVQDDL